jgi:23S rRNA G2069 N7-methylase RlmK/C1962 C5-methylase RlmI
VGIDINPQRIKEATENLAKAGVGDKVKFLNQDLFETDLSEATVITLYSAAVAQPEADAEAQTAEAGHAHRVAQLRHGDGVAAGKDRRRQGRVIYYWTIK